MKRPGAVVLAGGGSRRMGRAKAWLPFGNTLLLQRVVGQVMTAADPVVVVAASDQPLPSLPGGVAVHRDAVAGRGPLQGVATGLAALPSQTTLVYITATDLPFLVPGWIETLIDQIGEADVAVPIVDGRAHPLAAVYRRATALAAADALLAAGETRLMALLKSIRSREVPAERFRPIDPDLRCVKNLNTPEDYQNALRLAGLPVAVDRDEP